MGSENTYFSLEFRNTASHNIGAWDRMMTSCQKTHPYHEPIGPKPPSKFKKCVFYPKLHEATSHYRVWRAL